MKNISFNVPNMIMYIQLTNMYKGEKSLLQHHICCNMIQHQRITTLIDHCCHIGVDRISTRTL